MDLLWMNKLNMRNLIWLIKSSLEINVELYVNSLELLHLLQNHDLKSIFTTSDATISSSLEMIENCSFDIY
ncbi:uncharacterized protein OCT59_000206 [Rhizophagus irregularis]|uniref:uncharacterized protein n=1 Tax=Rhizophagus irregularis TaxID=588596 RepID=UPI003325B557|nr:hypothetical protein OCT59_000206 [Rhizophagus irregularis]